MVKCNSIEEYQEQEEDELEVMSYAQWACLPSTYKKVNPGSKAALQGIREGDLISSINGQSTRELTNQEAHGLLRNAGDSLKLGLNQENGSSPKRRVYKSSLQEVETIKKTTTLTTTTTTNTQIISTETKKNGKTEKDDATAVTAKQNGDAVKAPAVATEDQETTTYSSDKKFDDLLSSTTPVADSSHDYATEMPCGSRSRRNRRNRRGTAKKSSSQQSAALKDQLLPGELPVDEVDDGIDVSEDTRELSAKDLLQDTREDAAREGEKEELEESKIDGDTLTITTTEQSALSDENLPLRRKLEQNNLDTQISELTSRPMEAKLDHMLGVGILESSLDCERVTVLEPEDQISIHVNGDLEIHETSEESASMPEGTRSPIVEEPMSWETEKQLRDFIESLKLPSCSAATDDTLGSGISNKLDVNPAVAEEAAANTARASPTTTNTTTTNAAAGISARKRGGGPATQSQMAQESNRCHHLDIIQEEERSELLEEQQPEPSEQRHIRDFINEEIGKFRRVSARPADNMDDEDPQPPKTQKEVLLRWSDEPVYNSPPRKNSLDGFSDRAKNLKESFMNEVRVMKAEEAKRVNQIKKQPSTGETAEAAPESSSSSQESKLKVSEPVTDSGDNMKKTKAKEDNEKESSQVITVVPADGIFYCSNEASQELKIIEERDKHVVEASSQAPSAAIDNNESSQDFINAEKASGLPHPKSDALQKSENIDKIEDPTTLNIGEEEDEEEDDGESGYSGDTKNSENNNDTTEANLNLSNPLGESVVIASNISSDEDNNSDAKVQQQQQVINAVACEKAVIEEEATAKPEAASLNEGAVAGSVINRQNNNDIDLEEEEAQPEEEVVVHDDVDVVVNRSDASDEITKTSSNDKNNASSSSPPPSTNYASTDANCTIDTDKHDSDQTYSVHSESENEHDFTHPHADSQNEHEFARAHPHHPGHHGPGYPNDFLNYVLFERQMHPHPMMFIKPNRGSLILTEITDDEDLNDVLDKIDPDDKVEDPSDGEDQHLLLLEEIKEEDENTSSDSIEKEAAEEKTVEKEEKSVETEHVEPRKEENITSEELPEPKEPVKEEDEEKAPERPDLPEIPHENLPETNHVPHNVMGKPPILRRSEERPPEPPRRSSSLQHIGTPSMERSLPASPTDQEQDASVDEQLEMVEFVKNLVQVLSREDTSREDVARMLEGRDLDKLPVNVRCVIDDLMAPSPPSGADDADLCNDLRRAGSGDDYKIGIEPESSLEIHPPAHAAELFSSEKTRQLQGHPDKGDRCELGSGAGPTANLGPPPTDSDKPPVAGEEPPPDSLKDLCIKKIRSMPCGERVIHEISDPKLNIFKNLNVDQEDGAPSKTVSDKIKHFENYPKNTSSQPFPSRLPQDLNRTQAKPWIGVPTSEDPKLLVCFSPSQQEAANKMSPDKLLDLHTKFLNRHGYNQERPAPVSSPPAYYVTPKSNVVPENEATQQTDNDQARLRATRLSDWLSLARGDNTEPRQCDKRATPDSHVAATAGAAAPPPPRFPTGSPITTSIDPPPACGGPGRYVNPALIIGQRPEVPPRAKRNVTVDPNCIDTRSLFDNGPQPPPMPQNDVSAKEIMGNLKQLQAGMRDQMDQRKRYSLPQEYFDEQLKYIERLEDQLREVIIAEAEEKKAAQEFLNSRDGAHKDVWSESSQKVDGDSTEYHSKEGSREVKNDGNSHYSKVEERCTTYQKSKLKDFLRDLYDPTKRDDKPPLHAQEESLPRLHQVGVSVFPQTGEVFRQQMFNEYQHKVLEREERKHHRVIKISSHADLPAKQRRTSNRKRYSDLNKVEQEFIQKAKSRLSKHGIKLESETEDSGSESRAAELLQGAQLISGEEVKDARNLPEHLQEFLTMEQQKQEEEEEVVDVNEEKKRQSCEVKKSYEKCKGASRNSSAGSRSELLHEIDGALRLGRGFLLGKEMIAPKFKAAAKPGIWSPGSNSTKSSLRQSSPERKNGKDDGLPPIWAPSSAGPSPVPERKEFRPVTFESPILGRKKIQPQQNQQQKQQQQQQHTQQRDNSGGVPPWDPAEEQQLHQQQQQQRKEFPSARIVNSYSAPNHLSGAPRLPRAQNPTITLLQKAREGSLPKGAAYLDETDHIGRTDDKPLLSPGELKYLHRKGYESEPESYNVAPKRTFAHRKYEGIGPTTRTGLPLAVRSEIKDSNQEKWYKRMYNSLHRIPKNDDYVTIRYRPHRGTRTGYSGTSSGYLSEPEPSRATGYSERSATLDNRRLNRQRNKENDFSTSTLPRPGAGRMNGHYSPDTYHMNPGRIEDYVPGNCSIQEKETKEPPSDLSWAKRKWWDEVMDIFDGPFEQSSTHSPKSYMTHALKESGYESDSTLVFRRRDDVSPLSPIEQRIAYKTVQKGGDVPLHGLRKPAPERPKEYDTNAPPPPPPKAQHYRGERQESPRRYVEGEVTIHYRSPVRAEAKEPLSEEELARRSAENMRRVYQEERRRKYLQELQDIDSRRHTDNFIPENTVENTVENTETTPTNVNILYQHPYYRSFYGSLDEPSQKSPIPLNRYDDFVDDLSYRSRSQEQTPEPRLVARALYNFVGQTQRELTFRRGDLIFVRRQVDKNWYEGEHNAMVGLFPFNYVEIIPFDEVRTLQKKPFEGQARAKFNFIAQTNLELSLAKGELVYLTRRVDENWWEGRVGGRKGIFPVSYVEVLTEPGHRPETPVQSKPVASPAAHSMLSNGSASGKLSMGSHHYSPSLPVNINTTQPHYNSLPKGGKVNMSSLNEALHIDTHSEPIPYRALYNYRPQNEDELELQEGDTVYVMEKCDDGWYVGSSQRTGYFGTFPGNYVERL